LFAWHLDDSSAFSFFLMAAPFVIGFALSRSRFAQAQPSRPLLLVNELQTELNLAAVTRRSDGAELRRANGCVRTQKLTMIQRVEQFRAEFHPAVFAKPSVLGEG
jgi:hypothetical protein